MFNRNLFSSKEVEWETPFEIFDKLNKEFRFEIDLCANPMNAKCSKYFTKEDDALTKPWKGVCFCNPPYGRDLKKFVMKASEDSIHYDSVIVMLIPARTDTSYFHDYIYHKQEVRFIRGRIDFELDGKKVNKAPFPSMVVVFKNRKEISNG